MLSNLMKYNAKPCVAVRVFKAHGWLLPAHAFGLNQNRYMCYLAGVLTVYTHINRTWSGRLSAARPPLSLSLMLLALIQTARVRTVSERNDYRR